MNLIGKMLDKMRMLAGTAAHEGNIDALDLGESNARREDFQIVRDRTARNGRNGKAGPDR